jgi:hypothetical protein
MQLSYIIKNLTEDNSSSIEKRDKNILNVLNNFLRKIKLMTLIYKSKAKTTQEVFFFCLLSLKEIKNKQKKPLAFACYFSLQLENNKRNKYWN